MSELLKHFTVVHGRLKKEMEDERGKKKIFSRNYGREPTFHILYSSRYFNTKKMKKTPKSSKIEEPTKNKKFITRKTENHNIKKKTKKRRN